MIDHVLGRPSTRFRKYQVFTVVLLWSVYLYKGPPHGPKPVRKLSRFLTARLTTWRTLVVFCLSLYVSRNFARVVGLESPEPLANLYSRSYFRATWVTTALDAGFWTAMHLRPKWVRDLASVAFTVYYLICAEQADEMVRKVRGGLTLQHLRVSWDKPNSPYIAGFTKLLRSKAVSIRYPPRRLRIHRPQASSYREPIDAWLYYDGPVSELKQHDKVILDVPGGGFVAMDPRCHDDKLLAWAAKTGLPVLALNYRKAPEYPYPYALNECYDAYHTLITTRGQCIGMSGAAVPKVVVSGDSAGGNLAVGLVLMLLQESPHTPYFAGDRGRRELPLPEALVTIYPALDMNIHNWMTDEQMALLKRPERRTTNRAILRQKSEDYRRLTPDTPHGSEDENDDPPSSTKPSNSPRRTAPNAEPAKPDPLATVTSPTSPSKPSDQTNQPLRTRLAMSSMISYFNDRILSPEMLRAMIILYIGPHNRPDFATDYLLSPLLAPDSLLAAFPKLYMLTGERDPLVDHTVIFAGRLRQAKLQRWQERRELGLIGERERFDEREHVQVMLIPGISHGFLQFVSVFPDGWSHIAQCARWMREVFRAADAREDALRTPATAGGAVEGKDGEGYFDFRQSEQQRRRRRTESAGSTDRDERPLEMSFSSANFSFSPSHVGADKAGFPQTRSSGRGRSRAGKPSFKAGHQSPVATRRRRSLVRLASHEDLMGRRMRGLTRGMMGSAGEGGRTP
ncbi:hypothetical protein LTR08_004233 [Meristemomyces frigidus]|nr:hypothetical protein LTR08_004233 [Meristemomyces frigidus]